MEVRVLRRLPAVAARLRGRAAHVRRRDRDRLFAETTRGVVAGPYDLSLVEGSITTPEDAERIQQVRRQSRRPVTIGACATAGGIQALRNFGDVEDFLSVVYASPEYVSTLATSTPISHHVHVDFELHGCPIAKEQLLEVISAFLHERRPAVAGHSGCVECKRRGNVGVMVAHGTPCLGPVTHAGCGALCPSYDRGCLQLFDVGVELVRGEVEAPLGPVCRNPFRSIVVRSVEILYALDEALRLLAAYEPPDPPAVVVEPRAGTGYGWTEAPRGMLWHAYTLAEDGTITGARIVSPTSQNQATIEADLRAYVAAHLDLPDAQLTLGCEQTIRNHDPCISRATHFLALEVDRA